jgi:hypothetical protein
MSDKPFKKVFSKVGRSLVKIGLPALATAVGGPAGGIVAATIGGLLGVDAKDETALERAIESASPETLTRLREIEAGVEIAAIQARETEERELTARHAADMMGDSWLSKNIRPIVLAFVVLSFVLLIYCAAFFLPLDRALVVTPLVTALGGIVMTVIGFYFGGRSLEKGTSFIKS